MYKKSLIMIVVFAFISSLIISTPSSAFTSEEEALKGVLRNSLYGGGIGTLLGGASILLFYSDTMESHLDIFAMGAGAGIIAGTVYGVVKTATTGIANLENGKFYVGLPSPQINSFRSKGLKEVNISTSLFQFRF